MAFLSKHELPKVNLSGLDLSQPSNQAWEAARADVARALSSYGGLVAVYDRVMPEINEGVLRRVMPKVFMDMDGKPRTPTPSTAYDSLWFPKTSLLPLKCLRIVNPDSLPAVQECSLAIWPQGNDLFCNTIWNHAKQMKVMTQMIHRMVLESLGLEDEYDSHMNSLAYSIRLSEYINDNPNQETKAGVPPHVDPNFVSVIWQQEEGLEVETSNGEWLHVTSMPNSFTVLLGEVFSAWTNGRFGARRHRVRMDGMDKRFSAIFNSFPSHEKETVEIPDKLVDEKHPLLFKPFKYYDYLKFRHSDEGEKHRDILKAFCGIEQPQIAV